MEPGKLLASLVSMLYLLGKFQAREDLVSKEYAEIVENNLRLSSGKDISYMCRHTHPPHTMVNVLCIYLSLCIIYLSVYRLLSICVLSVYPIYSDIYNDILVLRTYYVGILTVTHYRLKR